MSRERSIAVAPEGRIGAVATEVEHQPARASRSGSSITASAGSRAGPRSGCPPCSAAPRPGSRAPRGDISDGSSIPTRSGRHRKPHMGPPAERARGRGRALELDDAVERDPHAEADRPLEQLRRPSSGRSARSCPARSRFAAPPRARPAPKTSQPVPSSVRILRSARDGVRLDRGQEHEPAAATARANALAKTRDVAAQLVLGDRRGGGCRTGAASSSASQSSIQSRPERTLRHSSSCRSTPAHRRFHPVQHLADQRREPLARSRGRTESPARCTPSRSRSDRAARSGTARPRVFV